jgi:ComF family protein
VYQESLRKAILRLKFAGDLSLGELLARPMLDMLFRFGWQVDLVTPVPMGVARKLKRGYNQAALLALPLALGAGIAYRPQSLRKVRETPSQIGLGLTQRWENVAGAFQAREMIVSGKSVLVVDDVTTSGATMQACAQALSEAGARQVYGLTLARTVSEVQPYDCFAA